MPNRKRVAIPLYAFFALIYAVCALYAMSFFFQNSGLGDAYFRTRLDAMVDGYAAKPFVYRQLVPGLVRSANAVTPPDIRDGFNDAMEYFQSAKEFETLRVYMPWLTYAFPNKQTFYKRFLTSAVIFTFLIGYMAFIFLLARALYPGQGAVALFAPIFAIVAFTSFGYQWQYIYDISCLCLSAACMYFMYTQRFRLYMFAFLLSCLNKETAIFSLILFSIWHIHRLPGRKFLVLFVAQLVIYAFVRVGLSIAYLDNSGVFLENNVPLVLKDDILAMSDLHKAIAFAVMWFLFTFRWNEKPLFLKRALWLLPFMYVAYVFYGFPNEYRVFFDVHTPLVLLAAHTLIVGTGIASAPTFANLRLRRNDA